MNYSTALPLACLAMASALDAHSQTYPNRPIRLLVGYAPGGNQNAYARIRS